MDERFLEKYKKEAKRLYPNLDPMSAETMRLVAYNTDTGIGKLTFKPGNPVSPLVRNVVENQPIQEQQPEQQTVQPKPPQTKKINFQDLAKRLREAQDADSSDDFKIVRDYLKENPDQSNLVDFTPQEYGNVEPVTPGETVGKLGSTAVDLLRGGIREVQQATGVSSGEGGGLGKMGLMAKYGLPVVAEGLSAVIPQDTLGGNLALTSGLGSLKKTLYPYQSIAPSRPVSQFEKTIGAAVTGTTAVNPRFATAVVHNPRILDDATPTIKQVSQKFSAYFDSMRKQGLKTGLTSEDMSNLFNVSWMPENPSTLNNRFVAPVLEKLSQIPAGSNPLQYGITESELIFAERAAAAMQRAASAGGNAQLMSVARGSQNFLMQQIESAGFKELPRLKKQYFEALAKEEFQSIFPRNKNMSPNALRINIMLALGAKGVEKIFTGKNYLGGTADLLKAAAYSPYAVGKSIQAAAKIPAAKKLVGTKGIALSNLISGKISNPIAEEGRVRVISPDGAEGTIPAGKLEDAKKRGYKAK